MQACEWQLKQDIFWAEKAVNEGENIKNGQITIDKSK